MWTLLRLRREFPGARVLMLTSSEAPEDVRHAVEEALSFEEETAGRLMQTEFVAVPSFWTAGRAAMDLYQRRTFGKAVMST